MTPQDIDRLLIDWHRWNEADKPPLGYPSECPTFKLYRPTKVWQGYEYRIEAGREELCAPSAWVGRVGPMLDERIRGKRNPEGGWVIQPMERMQQIALEWWAKCLALERRWRDLTPSVTISAGVLRNPRLPEGDELDALVSAAREVLERRIDE